MATTVDQKERVEAFVVKLKELPQVEDAYIDDYGRYGNFSVAIWKPKRKFIQGKRVTFRSIIPTAKKLAKESGLIWRQSNPYVANSLLTLVDIDCQPYHAEINKFQEQVS
jgi:hypothetical protein